MGVGALRVAFFALGIFSLAMVFVSVGTPEIRRFRTYDDFGLTEPIELFAGQSYRVIATDGCNTPDTPVNLRVLNETGVDVWSANGAMVKARNTCSITATFAEFWVPRGGAYRIAWFVPAPGLGARELTLSLHGGLVAPLTAWGGCILGWIATIIVGTAAAAKERRQERAAAAAKAAAKGEEKVEPPAEPALKVARVVEGPSQEAPIPLAREVSAEGPPERPE